MPGRLLNGPRVRRRNEFQHYGNGDTLAWISNHSTEEKKTKDNVFRRRIPKGLFPKYLKMGEWRGYNMGILWVCLAAGNIGMASFGMFVNGCVDFLPRCYIAMYDDGSDKNVVIAGRSTFKV